MHEYNHTSNSKSSDSNNKHSIANQAYASNKEERLDQIVNNLKKNIQKNCFKEGSTKNGQMINEDDDNEHPELNLNNDEDGNDDNNDNEEKYELNLELIDQTYNEIGK